MRDVSAGGLAVQADLEAGEGESLRVRVQPTVGAPVEIQAIVWHAHRVRSRQSGETGFLLGLVISEPPEAWFERVGAPRARPTEGTSASGAPPSCCDGEAPATFLVRLKLTDSPRTRTYRLQAGSLAEAQARAEAEARDDWRVIEVRAA